MLNTIVRSCILAGTLAVPVLSAFPQQQPTAATQDPNSQKIGLVLEGGGALGLAHIGVITWLEEHRIPVSYVAGTSMGGLVGGVYATGRSPAEVRELVSTIPWNTVLRGQVPFQNLTFRRKEDSYAYPGSIEFGLKKGIQFPAGFNSGQEVQFILDRVALPYSTMQSFNDNAHTLPPVWPPILSQASHMSSAAARSRPLCGPLCRCRASFHRYMPTARSSPTADSSTTSLSMSPNKWEPA